MIAPAPTIPTPRVYKNMDDAEYRALPAISKSDLDKWSMEREIDPRNALFGTVFHAAILEPEIAREQIAVCPGRRNSKAWAEFVESNEDKWVLTSGEYDRLKGMVASVKEHPQLGKLRDMARADKGRTELVVVWRDEGAGVLCKAKIDQVTDNWVWDWKTSGSDRDKFGESIGAFFYHTQAAHYLTGARACGIEVKGFRFACSNKRKDWQYPCWVQDIEDAWMLAGLRHRQQMLTLFARYNPDHPAVKEQTQ